MNMSTQPVQPHRLFLASCLSLISTSFAFAVIGDIMSTLKSAFVLTNAQVGMIGGAALWGFTLSIIVLGPLCDALGMKRLMHFAFICHIAGPLIMIFAPGFTALFAGALVLALGNGTVEAACNPLVATLYPDNKTTKLNQFHVWFPGGIVIGGLLCFFLGQAGLTSWQLRLGIILIPTVIYGFLFLGQQFPVTERVQSGVSFGGMVKATLTRPLFWVLFLSFGLTGSLELGPNRWIPAILQAGGMQGILVLVWITGLMAVLRFYAGGFVHRLSPTGMLFASSLLTGAGLYGLSFAGTMGSALLAATVFAFGVCFFWPTLLGVCAERIPQGGALALALLGGMGMLASGLIASPLLGSIADRHLPERLDEARTRAVIADMATVFPALQAAAPAELRADYQPTIDLAASLQSKLTGAGAGLPHPETANLLRSAIGAGGSHPIVDQAKEVLNPADNHGGRMALRAFAPYSLILMVVFGILCYQDRNRRSAVSAG